MRDKDGVSAAVIMAEVVATLRARGTTVVEELETIARRYGLYVSQQVSVTKKGVEGADAIRKMMNALRASPPREVGSLKVLAVSDLESGSRQDFAANATTKLVLPKSNVLTFELAGRSRIIARPSGTEPKIKFYFDVREPVTESEPFADAEKRAGAALAELAAAFRAITGA